MREGKFAVEYAKTAFLAALKEDGLDLRTVGVRRGLEFMVEFFEKWGVPEVDVEEDGDGLLFQWGTYDWNRTGSPLFGMDITRQLIVAETDDSDEGMYQLSWTFHYEPNELTDDLGTGHEWFFARSGVSNPALGLLNSPILSAVEGLPVKDVTLDYGQV